MDVNEILTRAQEATISVSGGMSSALIADIRAGSWNNTTIIQACVAFANNLNLPITAIQPAGSRLAAAREWAAARLQVSGQAAQAADVAAGKMDWQPLVAAFLAGAEA